MALLSKEPVCRDLNHRQSSGYFLNWQDAKAKPLLEDALDRSRRVLGEKHPHTCLLTVLLGYVCSDLMQLDEAESLVARGLELRRSILGEEHPMTINCFAILARIYLLQQRSDKVDQAERLTAQALDLSRGVLIENSPFLASNLSALGLEYLEHGQIDKADILCDLAMQALRRKPDANPLANTRIITQLGAVRLAQHKYAEAERLLREGLPLVEKYWPNPTSRIRACKTRNLLQINAPTLKVCTTPTHLADACAAVIFGGGCAGNCNFNFSSNNCWSGSGCV